MEGPAVPRVHRWFEHVGQTASKQRPYNSPQKSSHNRPALVVSGHINADAQADEGGDSVMRPSIRHVASLGKESATEGRACANDTDHLASALPQHSNRSPHDVSCGEGSLTLGASRSRLDDPGLRRALEPVELLDYGRVVDGRKPRQQLQY